MERSLVADCVGLEAAWPVCATRPHGRARGRLSCSHTKTRFGIHLTGAGCFLCPHVLIRPIFIKSNLKGINNDSLNHVIWQTVPHSLIRPTLEQNEYFLRLS